jgi:hypothetical protein
VTFCSFHARNSSIEQFDSSCVILSSSCVSNSYSAASTTAALRCEQVHNALRSKCRICGEGMLKNSSSTTGVCTPQKCFRATLHANCTTDAAVCGARACNATTGLCAGEVSAPNRARCSNGAMPGACVHGQCRQVEAGVVSTPLGPVLGGCTLLHRVWTRARYGWGDRVESSTQCGPEFVVDLGWDLPSVFRTLLM